MDEIALQRGNRGSRGVTSRQRDRAECLWAAVPSCS